MLGDALPQANTTSSNSGESGNLNTNGSAEQLGDKKRVRTGSQDVEMAESPVKRQKGVAPIKAEYVALWISQLPSLTHLGTSSSAATTELRSRMRS